MPRSVSTSPVIGEHLTNDTPRLGQPEAALSPLVYEATSVPGIPDPFATFVFKYRSHGTQ